MTSRSLVSYEDITEPYVVPTKKRKRNKRSAPPRPVEENETLDDTAQSRELTHEEIWDDSALVEAWDAAIEEYEAYHGPDQGWKKEPLHKSPLFVSLSFFFFFFFFSFYHSWYNIPPKNLTKKSEHVNHPPLNQSDTQPIDFASFVPTHDASLSATLDTAKHQVTGPTHTSQLLISQDEAFKRAIQASYWSGYWAAVYHVRLVLFLVQTH